MYYYGARYYDPRISIFVSVDPLAEQFAGWTPYHYVHNNPINLIDPTGMYGESWEGGGYGDGPPEGKKTLYTNSSNAQSVVNNGFNGTKYSKLSNYNWFSTEANATGTGRTGNGGTVKVSNVDVSDAYEVTNKQINSFYNAAKKELGYTSEQLKSNPKLRAQVDGLKYKKLGEWMDEMGKEVYKVGKSYAISDSRANTGIRTLLNQSNMIKLSKVASKGLRLLGPIGTILTVYDVGVEAARFMRAMTGEDPEFSEKYFEEQRGNVTTIGRYDNYSQGKK